MISASAAYRTIVSVFSGIPSLSINSANVTPPTMPARFNVVPICTVITSNLSGQTLEPQSTLDCNVNLTVSKGCFRVNQGYLRSIMGILADCRPTAPTFEVEKSSSRNSSMRVDQVMMMAMPME